MEKNSVFQLSALSQNDQPNSSCPGCAVGADLFIIVESYGGCTFLDGNSPPGYPLSTFPLRTWVRLPIPDSNEPTPTWFFENTDGIDNAWIQVLFYTPGYPILPIHIDGSSMPGWVAQNAKQDTNQIYQRGDCGIIGYAQENATVNPNFWIYTLTGGICNPMVHPNG